MDIKNICVFCSSSDDINPDFFKTAYTLGKLTGKNNINLIHGAGKIGLMGELEKGARNFDTKVIGIIPEKLYKRGIYSETLDEIIITKDMKERKEIMRNKSDAFIILPGGFGTLEEAIETITLKQLKYHTKPVVFLNTNNFYDNLFKQFDNFYNNKFTNPKFKNLYFIAENPEQALEYILNYKYIEVVDKWL